MSPSEAEQWKEQNRQLAEIATAQALESASISSEKYNSPPPYAKVTDDYNYEHEVPVWQLKAADEEDEQRGAAAYLLLTAGRHWIAAGDVDNALKCLGLGAWLAWDVRGDEFRRVEIQCFHFLADVWLTRGENVALKEQERLSAKRIAARYKEREAFLESQYGNAAEAAQGYDSAGHLYWLTDEYSRLARAYGKATQLFEAANDFVRASSALFIRSQRLLADQQNDALLRETGLASYYRAARVLARAEGQSLASAKLALEAAERTLRDPLWRKGPHLGGMRGNPPSPDLEGLNLALISQTLSEAREAFTKSGEFERADQCHVILNRLRRETYLRAPLGHLHPAYLLSRMLDVVWRYGTHPGRLACAAAITVIVFVGSYWVAGDVQWHSSIQQTPLRTFAACVVLGLVSFFPAQLVVSFNSYLPSVQVGDVSNIVAKVEGIAGSIQIAMAIFFAKEWYNRRFRP